MEIKVIKETPFVNPLEPEKAIELLLRIEKSASHYIQLVREMYPSWEKAEVMTSRYSLRYLYFRSRKENGEQDTYSVIRRHEFVLSISCPGEAKLFDGFLHAILKDLSCVTGLDEESFVLGWVDFEGL